MKPLLTILTVLVFMISTAYAAAVPCRWDIDCIDGSGHCRHNWPAGAKEGDLPLDTGFCVSGSYGPYPGEEKQSQPPPGKTCEQDADCAYNFNCRAIKGVSASKICWPSELDYRP